MASRAKPFVFPLIPLSTPRLRLEPLDPTKHGPLFFAGCRGNPHLFDYLDYGPFTSSPQFEEWCRTRIQEKPTHAAWAIYVRTSATQKEADWEFAGLVGLINADVQNSSVEMGLATILPRFQHTFVSDTAVGLLLLFALDPPPLGLGLQRVCRLNHAANKAASRTAPRMGFDFEGMMRFHKLVPEGKIGNGIAVDRKGWRESRDSCIWAIHCDQWDKKRPGVLLAMEKTNTKSEKLQGGSKL